MSLHCCVLLSVALLLAAPTHAFVSRAEVRRRALPSDRHHFDAAPDYSAPVHVTRDEQRTAGGGTIRREQRVHLAGRCRSIDHESAIRALRCAPHSDQLEIALEAGAPTPDSFRKGRCLCCC